MYDVNTEDHVYVVTYKELIFTLIVFIVILVALFPKGILKDQISADKSNYDLSMVYLKDLLKHSPEDQSLQLIYLEKTVYVGDMSSAAKYVDKLLYSKNEYIRSKAFPLAYQVKKALYFTTENEHQKRQLLKELKSLFATIYREKFYDDENAKKWYQEAVFVNNDQVAYQFLKQALQKEPQNIEMLKDAYYISLKLYKRSDSMRYIDLLETYDTNNSQKWAMDKYYAFIRYDEYDKAEAVLRKYAQNSTELKEKLAKLYISSRKYVKASDTYIELYNDTQTKSHKDNYLTQAIKTLLSGNLLEKTARLIHRYESDYVDDKKMRQFFLKTYLATGNLDYATEYSKKILKYENKL